MRTSIKVKALAYLLILIFLCTTSYALTIVTNNSSAFNQGTYNNTYYNTTNAALQTISLSGQYTSQIFDAGTNSEWKNISWNKLLRNYSTIFTVDSGKDVFWSTNKINWTMATTNYGGSTSADGLAITPENELIILDGRDIYYSSDNGINWTKINDNFNPYNQNGRLLSTDNQNNLYTVDENQRVFKSTNKGYDWEEISSDFNPENKDARAMTADSNNTMFIVDIDEDIFSSSNQGINWTFVSNYGDADADGMTADQNNYLYILQNSDVYRSINSGLNWTKINDDFSPYSQTGNVILFNKNESLLIADTNGRIFQSTNQGINWTELGDCNGAATNTPRAAASIYHTTNISLLVRSCNNTDCSGENWTRLNTTSLQNISIPNNQYFQYRLELETKNTDYSPELYNIAIYYSWIIIPDTSLPQVIQITPSEIMYYPNTMINITANVTDDIRVDKVFANITLPNGTIRQITLTNTTPNIFFNLFTETTTIGTYTLIITANDTSNNINNTETTTFHIITPPDTIYPTAFNLIPYANLSVNTTQTIEISANATDNIMIDTVLANITYPNSTTQQIMLSKQEFTDKYNTSFTIPALFGRYNITFIANDTSGNINNTETTYLVIINTTPPTIPDTTPPAVRNITPLAGTNFSLNSIVDITVNITDNTEVDTVFANITNPDLTTIQIPLFDTDSNSIYNNSVIANQPGWYHITIIANDTSGNINNTEKTNFDPAELARGGGGGGGGVAMQAYQSLPDWRKLPSTQIIRPKECIESWLCDPWTNCTDGKQTRTCNDYYNCGTEKIKPPIERNCTAVETEEPTKETPQEQKPSPIRTAMAAGIAIITQKKPATMTFAGIISVLIITAITAVLLFQSNKKQKAQKNKKIKENTTKLISKLKGVYKL